MSYGGPASGGDRERAGVYYAVVTQNDDPDGPGARVKVRFPWMPEGGRDQSRWAPVASPMVGDGFGVYWLPEVGDVVAVVFLGGDFRSPVVIGGQWNEPDPPPEKNEDGKNDFRLLKSRSGHRLLFDDAGKKVVLTDKTDANVVGCGPFSSSGSGPNTFEIPSPGGSKGVGGSAGQGTLNVRCPAGTLKLEAMNVEITASEGGEVKANATLTLESATEVNLSSSGSGTIKGSQTKFGV